jgi:hypothetical protein
VANRSRFGSNRWMVLAVATSTQTAMGVTAHLTRRRDYRVSELVEDIRALHRTRTAHGPRRGADPRQRPRTAARRKVARWRITHLKCLGRALPVALAHGDDGWLGGLGRSRPVSRDHRRGGAHARRQVPTIAVYPRHVHPLNHAQASGVWQFRADLPCRPRACCGSAGAGSASALRPHSRDRCRALGWLSRHSRRLPHSERLTRRRELVQRFSEAAGNQRQTEIPNAIVRG